MGQDALMPDLNIITDRWRDRASVNAESDAGLDWLAEHVVGLFIERDAAFSTTVEGAQEIEQLARKDGLQVEIR